MRSGAFMKAARLFAKLLGGKDKAFSRATERGRFKEFESGWNP
jgi:hypothetical protein